MVFEDNHAEFAGETKGMRSVLTERELWREGVR